MTSVSLRAEVGGDLRAPPQRQVAQERIDADDFDSASTARQVPFVHLDAAPAALRCIACQIACAGGAAQGLVCAVTSRTICSITCICGAALVK